MVEKIDRPDAPNPYRITQAKDPRENQHHQQQSEEEKGRYRRETEKEWKKFGSRAIVIKSMRVQRSKIGKLLFRAVSLRSGVGTLQADAVWSDGKMTKGILILLRKVEDFIRLKKFAPGQEVPESFWARGDIVEMGIPHLLSRRTNLQIDDTATEETSEITNVRHRQRPKWLKAIGVIDRRTQKINWGVVALYLIIVLFLIAVAVL